MQILHNKIVIKPFEIKTDFVTTEEPIKQGEVILIGNGKDIPTDMIGKKVWYKDRYEQSFQDGILVDIDNVIAYE